MTSGGGQREESVQFSLQELLDLEDERLEEQRREQQARERTQREEREAAERRAREEAAAKEQATAAEEERRRKAELDELARREAIQKAVVEQSRLEVEVRARANEREAERRHELEMQRLRVTGSKGQLGSLVGAALLGGAVVLLVALGTHFGVTKPLADRRMAELEQRIAAEGSRADDLGRRVDERRATIEGLETKLAEARTEIARLSSAKTTSGTATNGAANTPPGQIRGRPPTTTSPSSPSTQPPCPKFDPMCF
jgi:hypothetical protein